MVPTGTDPGTLTPGVPGLSLVLLVTAGPGDRGSCPALLSLGGEPLVARAVRVLRTALPSLSVDGAVADGTVTDVTVAVPALRAAEVSACLASLARVTVVPYEGDAWSALAVVLASTPARTGVLLHDPRYPLVPPEVVRAVAGRLAGDPEVAAAVPVRAVTDTLKRVADDGTVLGTLARDAFRTVLTPQAYRRDVLLAALRRDRPAGDPLPLALATLVRRGGGRVATVPAPDLAVAVTDADDVLVAEVLAAEVDQLPG